MFGKIDVMALGPHPLYRFLKGEPRVRWNERSMILRNSWSIEKAASPAFRASVAPDALEEEIEKLFRAGACQSWRRVTVRLPALGPAFSLGEGPAIIYRCRVSRRRADALAADTEARFRCFFPMRFLR